MCSISHFKKLYSWVLKILKVDIYNYLEKAKQQTKEQQIK